ncbi:MAG: hypothetical protein RRA15_10590 [bacterium]|nr:hypothetical protein [bacterium]
MYFKLILEGGHVGAGKSLETVRFFRAQSTLDAFDLANRVPRVKGKSIGTGVKLVQQVSREEYKEGVRRTSTDPYLNTRRKSRRSRRKSKEILFH